MKPLIVLIVIFIAGLLVAKIFTGEAAYFLCGRIAMCVMLLFTAIGHFVYSKGMTLMMPAFIPFKKELVFLTGIIEILAAIGLLLPQFQHIAGWLLIIFFILVLPANINAAVKKIDYQKGTTDGSGVAYLWFRVPLQLLFILWVLFFCNYSLISKILFYVGFVFLTEHKHRDCRSMTLAIKHRAVEPAVKVQESALAATMTHKEQMRRTKE